MKCIKNKNIENLLFSMFFMSTGNKKDACEKFWIDSNPQKVGSEQSGVKTARLQVVSRCERDLFRKRRNNGAGDWFFIKWKIGTSTTRSDMCLSYKIDTHCRSTYKIESSRQPITDCRPQAWKQGLKKMQRFILLWDLNQHSLIYLWISWISNPLWKHWAYSAKLQMLSKKSSVNNEN